MNEKLLLEYVDRVGLVASVDLAARIGMANTGWMPSAAALVNKHALFLCRLDHGRETLLSTHLFFCLQAVYHEPELSGDEQAVYNAVGEYAAATADTLLEKTGVAPEAFGQVFQELQRRLCVVPCAVADRHDTPLMGNRGELQTHYRFRWCTTELWMGEAYRPRRYGDLAYCVSELKRYLAKHLSTTELNRLLYHGRL